MEEMEESMPKGFRRPERTTTLVFDEGEYAGAEVTVVTNPSWRVYHDVMLYLDASDEPDEGEERIKGQAQKFEGLIALIASDVLRGWNVVGQDDEPIPATTEGLRTMPPDFLGALVGYWSLSLGASPSLANGSSAGEPTPPTPKAAKRSRPRRT